MANRRTAKHKTHAPRQGARTRGKLKRWSGHVTRKSDALTLDSGVFKRGPRAIARSLKRSAERGRRRKSAPFRSAMSMLTFYINRAGKGLSVSRRYALESAKDELRRLFGKAPS